jgi:HlyD family secretion protein
MSADHRFKERRSGRVSAGALIVFVAIALGTTMLIPSVRESVVSLFTEQHSVDSSRFVLHPVIAGPFRIEIVEEGKVDSVRSATLSSGVKGTTTIISLVPEGSMVNAPTVAEIEGTVKLLDSPNPAIQRLKISNDEGKSTELEVQLEGFTQLLVEQGQHIMAGDFLAGDLVCELDSSTLIESELKQQIRVTGAQASLEKAANNLKIQFTTNEKYMAAAELAKDLAELDEKTYTSEGGQYDQSLQTILGAIKKNEEDLAISQEEYDRVRELARKGYTSLYNLEAARVAVTQQKIVSDVKKGELKVLKNFTRERTTKELNELAKETVLDITRAAQEAKAAMDQMRAAFKAAQLTLELESETLYRLRRQIADCRLVAPQAGEVVYATQSSRRSEPIVIEPGAQVRERQAIIKLPDLGQMKVAARIHESRIRQVKEGQLVDISVSSLPGLQFHGRLDTVASLPVPADWPNRNQMEFDSVVTIIDSAEMVAQLKPGMGTELRIIVEERDVAVLQVPVQSIVSIAGEFFTYVQTDQGPTRRSLMVGKSNDEFMEILDGVASGENVILNPRTHFSQEINQLELDLSKDADQSTAESQPTVPARKSPTG